MIIIIYTSTISRAARGVMFVYELFFLSLSHDVYISSRVNQSQRLKRGIHFFGQAIFAIIFLLKDVYLVQLQLFTLFI